MTTLLRHLKLRLFSLAFLLGLILMNSSSFAQTGIATAGVNVRTAPNNGPKDGAVPAGTRFEIVGSSGDWTKVRLTDGRVRYIYSRYVDSTPGDNSATAEGRMSYATVGVNFRQSPNGRVLTGVGKNTQFEVIGTNGNWSKVRLSSGQVGYIFSQYVKATEAGYCTTCELAAGTQPSPSAQEQALNVSDIVNAVSGSSMDAVAAKALSQVTCPVRNIGKSPNRCGSNGYRKSSYDCAFYVRKALTGTVLPSSIGGLGHARDMGCNLKSRGMKNLCGNNCGRGSAECTLDSSTAPLGSVLVYANVSGYGCHWAGHAEIRTEKGFVSDFLSAVPRNKTAAGRNCRKLIGIWVK